MRFAFTYILLTPVGRGAVATISMDGPECLAAVRSYFRPYAKLTAAELPIDRILVGHWQSLDSATEEVVVCRRAEQRVEVNCHGGQAACQAILSSLKQLGGVEMDANAWLRKHCESSFERDAWVALRAASTPRVAGILLDQYRGATRNMFADILQLIEKRALDAASRRIQQAIGHSELGRHLTKPFRTVVAGPPNVGKSSLLNALLGYERAIVYDQPGTTRDVLSATTAIEGWPIELIDTAGLRTTTDAIEAEGVVRANAEIQTSDLVLLVLDHQTANQDLSRWLAASDKTILIANKSDLAPVSPVGAGWIPTSAVTGEGLQVLMRTMIERLVPHPPLPGEAIPFTETQVATLRALSDALTRGDVHEAKQLLPPQDNSRAVISE